MHEAGAKRGKLREGKSRLVLVLLLIGSESGTSFFSQLQTIAMQNRSNREITFDAQMKTVLLENGFYQNRAGKDTAPLITLKHLIFPQLDWLIYLVCRWQI